MLKKFFLDIIYPIKCLGCKKSNIWLCEDCFNKIKISEKRCESASFLNGLIIATDYEDELVRKIISKFKYSFIQELKESLGKLLIKKFKQLDNLNFDYIIPIPLFKRRELWRGFNQAELLAQEVSKEFSIPVLNNLVVRNKHTSQQVGQKKQKREENLKDAFKVNQEIRDMVRNKKILLVDDVFTTGITMEEVAKELKDVDIKEVWGLVVAKG
ncbi:MAG: ComF family protein [Patescibacteria group bacterium]